MSKAFESIKAGLQQAIAHGKGGRAAAGVKVYHPLSVDVKEVRQRVGMTQAQFAARFGFSVATLRHWERGDRAPAGPALVLLNVISKDHKAVMKALTV
jgi:putative transcriptional regulator